MPNEESDTMAGWRVQLQGNDLYLQALKEILLHYDPTIIQDSSAFYLTSKDWDQFEEVGQVRDQAKHVIGLLDRAVYLHSGNTAPIEIVHIVRIDDEGRMQKIFVEAQLTSRWSVMVTVTVQQQRLIIRSLRVSTEHSSVADALRFFHKGDWISLYKAFEIVRDEVDGEESIIRQNWLTKKSIRRFRQTAQSREALGDDARHASREDSPPKKPMSTREATATIGELLKKWIDTLGIESPPANSGGG